MSLFLLVPSTLRANRPFLLRVARTKRSFTMGVGGARTRHRILLPRRSLTAPPTLLEVNRIAAPILALRCYCRDNPLVLSSNSGPPRKQMMVSIGTMTGKIRGSIQGRSTIVVFRCPVTERMPPRTLPIPLVSRPNILKIVGLLSERKKR